MVAPMRSVMAMQQMHCDMDASSSVSEVSVSENHASHDMSSMSPLAFNQQATNQQPSEKNQHSCCSGSGSGSDSCSTNCDMGMAVSLLIQATSYAPLFLNVAEAEGVSSAPIVRELTPPSRPPANFS